MQREGSWARVAWLGHKLSTMVTVGHIIRIKKQLNAEPGLNDFVTMALDADGLGVGVFDRLIELGHLVRFAAARQRPSQRTSSTPAQSGTGIFVNASSAATSTSIPTMINSPSSSATSSGS
jgi:hypothetical protein